MNRSIKLILLVVTTALFGFATEANAQGRGSLSARVGGFQNGVKFKKACQSFRVNDCGKPMKSWRQQVVYRATNDTFVYRSENKATTRHDEVSSHAIMFHLENGQIRNGHAFQVRDN